MKISIITCTWNSELYLLKAIQSVLMQNYDDIEFIFVDGGSNDSTISIIDAVSAPKKVLHDVKGGISKAMNAGIEAARGDVLIHLHSDDYLLHSNVFSRVIDVFLKTQCEWLFGRILNDRSGALCAESYIPPIYSYANLTRANFIPHAATFVKRSLFQRVGGFSESLRFAMDYEMWLRIGRISEPIALPEVLSVFRRHEGSTTEKNRLGSFDEDYDVRRRYIETSPLNRVEHALRYRIRRARLIKQLDELI